MFGRWACSVCGVAASDCHTLLGQPCTKPSGDMVEAMRKAGHRPGAAATPKGRMWFCHICGRYGVARLKGLVDRCEGTPSVGGSAALRRLAKNLHPVSDQGSVVVLRGWRVDGVGGRALGA